MAHTHYLGPVALGSNFMEDTVTIVLPRLLQLLMEYLIVKIPLVFYVMCIIAKIPRGCRSLFVDRRTVCSGFLTHWRIMFVASPIIVLRVWLVD